MKHFSTLYSVEYGADLDTVALENMFLGQGLLLQPLLQQAALLKSRSLVQHEPPGNPGSLAARIDLLRNDLSEAGTNSSSSNAELDPDLQTHFSAKRRRTEDGPRILPTSPSPPAYIQSENSEWGLPPADLVDSLVEIYFATIHPWIPMLHVRDFRQQMQDPSKRQSLNTIFHAIVSICVRFSTDQRVSNPETRARFSKCSRQMVILQSMEAFSIQNLQAMIIIAFDTVGTIRSLWAPNIGHSYRSDVTIDWKRSWAFCLVDRRKHDTHSGAATAKC